MRIVEGALKRFMGARLLLLFADVELIKMHEEIRKNIF